MKLLIVNADDFGFTRDVNAGIVAAHQHGILTATTLMANGDAFDDAVALAHDVPTLDIGVHLVFVQGRSVLHPTRELPPTLGDLIKTVWHGELEIYEEAAAQIRKILAAGIRPSHLDTHKHTHLLPPILKAVARVAREFNIPWVRRPFDFALDSQVALKKRAVTLGMRMVIPNFNKQLAGLRSTDHFAGFQITGTLHTGSLRETLKRLPEGRTELMCHPGTLGAELRIAQTRLKESRAIELAALTAPETKALVRELGIQLTNYRG